MKGHLVVRTYHICFVIEQALGHATHAQNLQATVPCDPEVQAHWGLVPWEIDGLARRLPIYHSNWTLRAGLRARRLVSHAARRAPIDALFFHTQVPATLAVDWLRRFPAVVSLDATPIQYDELGQFYGHSRGPAWLERLKWQLHRDCFFAARQLVVWSAWAGRGLVRDYDVPEDKIVVIPPGVNASEWARPTPRRPHDPVVKILFVGGDLARKGGRLLLEVFRQLRSLGAELHIVTHDKVQSEPGVYVYDALAPNSATLKQLYHECDIFCLPTYGDCLPMVLLEAGAAGLPTVSTRLAGIPEIVRDGETGFLVPRGDGQALAEALRRLVLDADLRLCQGRRAGELIPREFDAARNTRRLLDLLKREIDVASERFEVADE